MNCKDWQKQYRLNNKEKIKDTQEKYKKKFKYCLICGEVMKYYSYHNHKKTSKHRLKEIENMKYLDSIKYFDNIAGLDM